MSSEIEYANQSEAYKNFINSVDSPATKHNYHKVFPYFMKFCNMTKYEDMLLIEVKKLEGLIRDYIIYLREDKKLSPGTISMYLSAITESVVEDQPYTRKQIKILVDAAPLREKCIILVMASAGLRRGAVPYLRIKDLVRIDKYNLYKINVYKREQEQYATFCTPECARYIDQYLDWRRRLGERLLPNSPLFRRAFDAIIQINKPIALSELAISYNVGKLLDMTAVRVSTETKKRTELMQTHGFRKFFILTNCKY